MKFLMPGKVSEAYNNMMLYLNTSMKIWVVSKRVCRICCPDDSLVQILNLFDSRSTYIY